MKVLSKIGGFAIQYVTEISVLALSMLLIWLILSTPNSVRLTEGEWVCTRAGTDGLGTQCLEYRRVEK